MSQSPTFPIDRSAIFHLAIPVDDIAATKAFYVDGLGCKLGRESPQAMILNFFQHQLVAHMTKEPLSPQVGIYPRHFGMVFPSESQWEQTLARARDRGLAFYQEPKLRFREQLTEHRTFFLQDPAANLLEFKYYRHAEAIFGGRELSAIGDR